MGLRETLDRPECWDFAMEFLGCPENEQVVAYVERLEAALAQQPESGWVGDNGNDLRSDLTDHSGDADEMVPAVKDSLTADLQQPAAVVDLTDADILEVMHDGNGCRENYWQDHIDFARAVIAAHIAKQGGAA